MEIYERIKFLRNKIGITQIEFAESVNISRSNIGNIEIGRTTVTDRLISDICRVYEVNEEWLRTGEGEIFREKSVEDSIIDAFGKLMATEDNTFAKQFVAVLARLDPEDWKAIEKFCFEVVKGCREADKPPECAKKEEKD